MAGQVPGLIAISVPGSTDTFFRQVNRTIGEQFFVNSTNGSDNNSGLLPSNALATIDAAIGKCTAGRGDVIWVAAGHSETLTTAIAADVAGITIIGQGDGLVRPEITVGGAIDGIDVTADDVTIENIHFNEATAAATSNINIAAARCTLRRIHMDLGANDVDAITVTAAGELPTIEDCTAIVTANGPESWVKFEGVVDRPIIRRNHVVGSDGTNAFDDGVFDFNGQAVTNPTVVDNVFLGGGVATTVVANGGSVVGACYGNNVYAGSATEADNVGTGDVTQILAELSGSAGIASFPASAAPANGVSIAEVVRDTWDALRNGTGGAEPATNRSIMDYLGVTPAFFVPGLGYKVSKSHNIATDNVDLFTVTGKCLITLLAGEVTTVIATTTTYAMRVKTTNEAIFAATTITTDADDTMYLFGGDPTVALNNGGTPVTRVGFLDSAGPVSPLVVGLSGGTLTIESDLDGAGTGVIAWDLFYLPLETGASIVAA